MFIFGLMAVSTYFFIMTSIEKGMDQASRLIRTGQAQSQATPMTVGDFKKMICRKANSKSDSDSNASGWVKCNNLQVFVQTYPSWAAVVPTSCLNNNQAVVNTASDADQIATYSGEANAIVIVTACYRWKFAGKLPFINLGQMSDGSMMMQSATAFRTEPYAVQ
jgi:Flp pilus assembly protein TadG